MDYSQIIQEYNLSYDTYASDLPEDYNFYGIYDGRYDWYNKEGFKEFVLHYLIGHCIRLDIETPETLEEGLQKHFVNPEYAYKKVQEYLKLSEVAISADKNFQEIADFLNKYICNKFGPVRNIFWIGKLKEFVIEDSKFAKSQRLKFHKSPTPLTDDQIPDFVEFLEHFDYISDLREKYELAIEMPYEIEQMNYEPDYYFPTSKEILDEMKEFAINMKDQPNILKIILETFPEIYKGLPEDIKSGLKSDQKQ